MFKRDFERLNDTFKRVNILPLGSCALAGTPHNIDREKTAEILGFDGVCLNSIDGVSDRDFIIEALSSLSIIMTHLSRFCEEIILWASFEFKFIELDDSYATGSSIMPQKKNPDVAELIRGKTGRVYGDLFTLLTIMKSLPLAYNKDMQEDKEPLFDAVDTVKVCLEILPCMLETMKVNKENMLNAVHKGFLNATDVADYLVDKGVPFRKAHEISGNLVKYCESQNITLQDVTLEKYKEQFDGFENDIYEKIKPENSVEAKKSIGACSKQAVETVITINEKWIKDNEIN
jgi:argininosuccinate lyase